MLPFSDPDVHELHRLDLQRIAESDRLARRICRSRAIRGRVGLMLIKTGGLLIGHRAILVTSLDQAPVDRRRHIASS